MTRTRRTAGILAACLLLPPLLVGGLLKAGHYTFQTWKYSPSYHFWFLGQSNGSIDDSGQPVPGFDLVLYRYRVKVYRPQDVPPPVRWYTIDAQVQDVHKRGIPLVALEVYDLAGNIVDDPSLVGHASGYRGQTYRYVGLVGVYDVVAGGHGYLPIKKRIVVGPNGASVKFVLPLFSREGVPARRLPEAARW